MCICTWVISWWSFCAKPSPPPRWRIFSSCGGLVSFFERGALGPLRTSAGTTAVLTYIFVCVRVCMCERTHSPLPFAASFVRLYTRSWRVEGRPTAAREEDRAWPRSPAPRSAFIWSKNIFYVPFIVVTDISPSLSLSFSSSRPSFLGGLKYLKALIKLLLLFSLKSYGIYL